MPEERIYTIPLRNAFKTERVRRSKKAIKIVREFLQKHMKTESVKIGKSINEFIWSRGAKKPPRRIRIHTIKEDGIAYAEIVGIDIKTTSSEQKRKKEAKEKRKKEKIKKAREERKRMSLQQELDKSGKTSKKPEVEEEKGEPEHSIESVKSGKKPIKQRIDTK